MSAFDELAALRPLGIWNDDVFGPPRTDFRAVETMEPQPRLWPRPA